MSVNVDSNVDGVKFYFKIGAGKTEEYVTPASFEFVGSYYIRIEPYPTFKHWIRQYDGGEERKITNFGFASGVREGKNVFLTACFSAPPYIPPEKLKIASPLIIVGAIILFLILAFAFKRK